MKTVRTVAEVRSWRAAQPGSVGLVPTMGYLHAGHISLVEAARAQNEAVAATIFVNPTQFGPREDLSRYPRDLQRDSRMLEEAGCTLLFAPGVDDIYPAGHETAVEVGGVSATLEGERRPGHFRGVATVVLKLLNIVQPRRAYFGQKDAQQLAVIRKLVRDLDVPVEVRSCPIVREPDGLAMSSRNTYLDPAERQAALVLYRALRAAGEAWSAGERDAERLRGTLLSVLATEARARVDYASVCDPETFRELSGRAEEALACLAVFVGPTRLIDNLHLAAVRGDVVPGEAARA